MLCYESGVDLSSTSLDQPIEYLAKVFESGVGYSSIGTVKLVLYSKISTVRLSVLIMENGISFGKHPLVQGFMKDIFSLRLALPRQFAVWDPAIGLDYVSNLLYGLRLKHLSQKTSYFIVFIIWTKGANCEVIKY